MIKKMLMDMDSLKPWRKAANRFQRRAAVVMRMLPIPRILWIHVSILRSW